MNETTALDGPIEIKVVGQDEQFEILAFSQVGKVLDDGVLCLLYTSDAADE